MTRVLVLGTLGCVGALSLVVSGQAPPSGSTQGGGGHQDREGEGQPLRHHRFGRRGHRAFSGGNTAVFITDAGVTLVDTKLPGWGPTIIERVKSVTDKPITRIINTHTHGDHTGSNEVFGATVESIVHENTRTNMAKMDEFKGAKAKFLPKRDLQGQADRSGPARTRSTSTTSAAATPTATPSSCSPPPARCTLATCSRGRRCPSSTPTTAAASSSSRRRCQGRRRREERRHHHQRAYSCRDVARPAGLARLHEDFVTFAESSIKAGKSVEPAGRSTR